ncbi:hypothetical protein [Undibacterium sp. TJN19]|uniref:hypothetical protein n=1 Tax=Undibacterium sp. TJN19 TaxID=3413055 RepID=UPI003BF20D12
MSSVQAQPYSAHQPRETGGDKPDQHGRYQGALVMKLSDDLCGLVFAESRSGFNHEVLTALLTLDMA